jgi:hypothetical protein
VGSVESAHLGESLEGSWLVRASSGGLTLRDAKVFLTDCDENEVRTALPLAAVHVSNHLFWGRP